jgi:hypothetical protein
MTTEMPPVDVTVNLLTRIVKRGARHVVVLAVVAVVPFTTSTIGSAVSLASTQIFVMGGTNQPLASPAESVAYVQQYISEADTNYVRPTLASTWSTGDPAQHIIALITPEQVRYNTGPNDLTSDQSIAQGVQDLHSCITGQTCAFNEPASDGTPTAASATDPVIVFGYSQSATIAMEEKAALAAAYAAGVPSTPGPEDVSFVVIGNPNRPNGGYMARGPQGLTISSLGATFSGPAATDTPYSTVDIAQEYDGAADGPVNPLNLVAVVNALAGMYYLHPNYDSHSLTEPGIVNQGTYGDTTYYLIPAPIIPLLTPVQQIPVIGHTLADMLNPTLQVIVEAGYNRAISPGQPTPWNPLYFSNPISLVKNVLISIPTGLDNGIQDLVGVRPFGTQRPGPYGVGGPSVTYLTPPATATATTSSQLSSSPTSLAAVADPTTRSADHAQFSKVTSASPAGAPSASAKATLGLTPPDITRPPRLPIGATQSGPKAPTATVASASDGRVSDRLASPQQKRT